MRDITIQDKTTINWMRDCFGVFLCSDGVVRWIPVSQDDYETKTDLKFPNDDKALFAYYILLGSKQ